MNKQKDWKSCENVNISRFAIHSLLTKCTEELIEQHLLVYK